MKSQKNTKKKHRVFFKFKCFLVFAFLNVIVFCFEFLYRLLGANSTESVRCSYYSNCNESDLRLSGDNTCTDSLVTALDDEALLICDAGSEMARTKVSFFLSSDKTRSK